MSFEPVDPVTGKPLTADQIMAMARPTPVAEFPPPAALTREEKELLIELLSSYRGLSVEESAAVLPIIAKLKRQVSV